MSIEQIKEKGEVLAILIPAGFQPEQTQFLTPGDSSQQIGLVCKKSGETIPPHLHREVTRTTISASEFLLIRSGKVEIEIFSNEKRLAATRVLNSGDMIFLISGGHGFKILEDAVILEIRQGPFLPDIAKETFIPQSRNNA